jgi:hypothetical protein
MHYLLLIYADEQVLAGKAPDEQAAVLRAWFAYHADLEASGKLRDGHALRPTATATTLRFANGRPLVADGPFAETKEHLGGYYRIEAEDLDEALAWAAKMPHLAQGGAVEVRPVMVFEAAPPPSAEDAGPVAVQP